MAHGIRWVGVDVHAHESTIAIFDQVTGELTTRRVVGRASARPARTLLIYLIPQRNSAVPLPQIDHGHRDADESRREQLERFVEPGGLSQPISMPPRASSTRES